MGREETAVGYARTDGSLGLEAQQEAIAATCRERGWTLLRTEEDGERSAQGRTRALEAVHRGEAEALVVSSLDSLVPSVGAVAKLLEQAEGEGWNLVALDLGLDLSTPAGRQIAKQFLFVADWERRLVSERTRAALERKRAQGATLGTPRKASPSVADKIRRLRAEGMSLKAIADELNRLRVPTVRGGTSWRPSSVHSVLTRLS